MNPARSLFSALAADSFRTCLIRASVEGRPQAWTRKQTPRSAGRDMTRTAFFRISRPPRLPRRPLLLRLPHRR